MRRHLPSVLLTLGIFAVVVALAAGYWRHPLALAAVLAAGSALLFCFWHRLEDGIYYVVSAIVGPSGELVAIHAGAWSYAEHGSGIPLWLPLAWGVVGLSLRRLSVAVVDWARS